MSYPTNELPNQTLLHPVLAWHNESSPIVTLPPYQSRGSSCWSMECRLIAFITHCRQIQMYTRVTTRFHRILILLNYFSVCTPISPTLLTIACFWSLQMTRRMRLPFWLLHHLDNDTFPGVCWIDRANGIFQLPWCHPNTKSSLPNDPSYFYLGRFLKDKSMLKQLFPTACCWPLRWPSDVR